ncbi:MAG: hypothetical protein AAFR05_03795 [Bacteroidota bacterium]
MSFSDLNPDAQKKIEGYRPDIDAEALWRDIEPQLHPKKRRRFVFWWYLLGGSGLLFLGLVLVWGSSAVDFWGTTGPGPGSAVVPHPPEAILTPSGAAPLDPAPPAPATSVTSTGRAPASASTASGSFTPTSRVGTSSIVPKSAPALGPPEDEEGVQQTETTQSPTRTVGNEDGTKPNGTERTAPLLPQALMPLERRINPLPWQAQIPSVLRPLPPPPPNSPSPWGLGLYFGPGASPRQLRTRGEAGASYRDLRAATETDLETLRGGVYLQWRHPRHHWYWQLGLEYTRSASRFEWSDQKSIDTINYNGLQRLEVNAATGDTTFVYGPTPQRQIHELTRRRYNYDHLLQVPLLLGYRYRWSAWSLSAEGGVLVNVWLRRTGAVAGLNLDVGSEPEPDLYDLGEDAQDYFGLRGRIVPMLGAKLAYELPQGWTFFAAPRYQFPLDLSQEAYLLRERRTVFSLGLGVEYHF